MKNWNFEIYKKLHSRLRDLILSERNFDELKSRYISDLSDGFLFYYPDTGKILLSRNGSVKTVFRDENTNWLIKSEIEKLIDKLKYVRN